MDVTVRSIDELAEVVGILTQYIGEGYKVILLSGDLGSGKTTLTKALCSKLGVAEAITSPTFSLVNEPEHPDPSKAKPFNKHTPKDGHSLAPGECIKGTASHYGKDDGLYGRKTASGERLRPGLATIALPHYNNQKEKPFQVVLHNTRTGQEIQARVNDMGPNLRLGRAADLESATFKRLFRNASGLAEITVCRPK